MTDPSAGNLRPTSLDDRRNRKSRPSNGERLVCVVDGGNAGLQFSTSVRDVSQEQASFLSKYELRVGQALMLETDQDGRRVEAIRAEVVRCRTLSTGRWEIFIEFRRPVESPRPSESQRRHERRARQFDRSRTL